MDLMTVNRLLEQHNGNFSVFAKIFGDRLNVYKEWELPFPGEFLFFEESYLLIKKHMLENHIPLDIVDIGCQFGLQSEIFLDAESYVGIDCSKPSHFMNCEQPNIHYIVGLFPRIDIDLTGKTVISSMSLGYFDNWICEDEDQARKEIVDKLKDCQTLYIATKRLLVDMLMPYFKTMEILDEVNHGDFCLYVLRK